MRAFLIAGEPSGDNLGGALMAGLKALTSPQGVAFSGIGGPAMQAQGLHSLFSMEELSVMGIAEIAPKYFHLKRRIAEAARAVIACRPDVLITIDSPDFCLRVARLVRASCECRIVHYVAPTVWAWRPGRAARMAGLVDQVLALFPFEPPYMEAAGIPCDFVGHPVVTEPRASDAEAAAFRAGHGIADDVPVLLALPGSRRAEVARLSEVFGAAVERFVSHHPGARVVVPAAAPVASVVRDRASAWAGGPVILDPSAEGAAAVKRAAFRAADVALAASGTVSLELSAAGTPMVIAYDVNWLSRQIAGRMLRIDTVTLVNLVADSRAVPEFLGAECRPAPIAGALAEALRAPEAQRAAMAETMRRLGQGGEDPGLRAARAVLAGLGKTSA